MARPARVVAVGEPHHLTQRGTNRQQTFFDDHDRNRYCRLLRTHADRAGMRLLGYCLMTNHVHLVAVPERLAAFGDALGRLHGEYARRLHERWGGNGHLWQNRFYSCPLDRDHLWTALRYVDLNLVRAGLVADATEYEWSSARAHLEGRDWRDALADTRDEEAAEIAALRHATRTGRPLGGVSFVKRLEAMFGRKLNPKRPGPPKKAEAAAAGK